MLTDCAFTGLQTGIEVFGSGVPLIRRCRWDGITGDAVVFQPVDTKDGGTNSLGDANDPNTGYNLFMNVAGYDIRNQRPQTVLAQNCYFDDAKDANTYGIVDTSHELDTPLIPGRIIATVMDAGTNARIGYDVSPFAKVSLPEKT